MFKSELKVISFFLSVVFALCNNPVAGQECQEFEILKVAFQDLAENYKDTLVVKLKNDRGPFLIDDIRQVSDITEEQSEHIDRQISKAWDWESCPGIKELLTDLSINSPEAIKDTYYQINCSKPIFIMEHKAILLFSFSTRSKSGAGGKAVGADILDTYVLENFQWKRVERQGLSMN